MLKLEILAEKTREVFDYLYGSKAFRDIDMRLFGGTALALLLGHRLSEDLDFFCTEPLLPKTQLNHLLTFMREEGFHVCDIMDPVRRTQARINGIYLDDYIQEYTVNGVKVSFCTFSKGSPSRQRHFSSAPVLTPEDAGFSIPTLQTLFESKAVVLMDRVMSRDLFDLMVLIRDHGYTLNDLMCAIMTIDERSQNEALSVLEVLVGTIPMQASDPGFATIGLEADLAEIHAFFADHVDSFERQLAREAITKA